MNTTCMNKKPQHGVTGKRISINDLYTFIKQNKQVFENIGCVDLNTTEPINEELKKLQFQDIRKIYCLPESLSDFLQINSDDISKYLHAGTLVNTKNSVNISLFSSVISSLQRSFLSQTIISQEKFIHDFLERLKYNVGALFMLHKYDKTYNWSQTDICNDIVCGIPTGQVLKILSDYFCINIFILDLADEHVYFGGGFHYIPYKKTIFLLKFENETFEPFFTEQTRLFTLSDDIIKVIRDKISSVKMYNVYGYGYSKIEEITEDLTLYDPPIKKTRRQLEKEQQEKNKLDGKTLDNEIKKELDELSEKTQCVPKTQNEYDETMNGFIEDGSDSDENIEQLIKKKSATKRKDKFQWNIIEDNTEDDVEIAQPKTQVDISKINKMKLVELQEMATKLNIAIKENGKAVLKATLIENIKNSV